MALPAPDWVNHYKTPEVIEADLNKFKYKGEGWYLTKTDTLLITQSAMGQIFVQTWNYPSARREIAACLAMNIRVTEGEI